MVVYEHIYEVSQISLTARPFNSSHSVARVYNTLYNEVIYINPETFNLDITLKGAPKKGTS